MGLAYTATSNPAGLPCTHDACHGAPIREPFLQRLQTGDPGPLVGKGPPERVTCGSSRRPKILQSSGGPTDSTGHNLDRRPKGPIDERFNVKARVLSKSFCSEKDQPPENLPWTTSSSSSPQTKRDVCFLAAPTSQRPCPRQALGPVGYPLDSSSNSKGPSMVL